MLPGHQTGVGKGVRQLAFCTYICSIKPEAVYLITADFNLSKLR